MNINSAGGAGANLPQNLDDLAASPDVIKSVLENARMIASENEAIKQKLLGAMGATGPVDPKDLALISAEIGQKLQDALGGLRGLPAPDVTQGAGPVFDAMSRLSEQKVQTDIYAFMALFQQLAQTMRSSAREVRANELQAQVDTLKGAAQEMRDAAKDRMIGAMTQGAFQIFGGLAQAGSGGLQLGVLAKGGAGAEARARSLSDVGGGVSGVAGGIGTMINASQEQKAAEHEARRSELEAQSKVHESGMQQASEMAQQMMDVIRDVRDKLAAIEQSRMETNRGIARNI